MDVTIQERSISIGLKYDIETPAETWFARKEILALHNNIDLQRSEGGPSLAYLHGLLSPLRNKYEFSFAEGDVAEFLCTDLLHSVYQCTRKGAVFTLYEHHGLKYSVFLGDRQIAAYTRNRISFQDGNQYQLRVDADADLVLIVSMVLALSVSQDNDDKRESVNVAVGKIGPQGRPFDDAWEPR